MTKPVLILIHSPLVGPVSWSPVGDELRSRGYESVIPPLQHGSDVRPYWEQHASDVIHAMTTIPEDVPLCLVGHSGAGLLLPAIRDQIPYQVQSYIFVDAGIPVDGLSRLDLIRQESADLADRLSEHLEAGGRFPTWSADDLREIIPDDDLREALVADLRPQPLAFFSEPIPVFSGWPDAPCAYIQFSEAYDHYAGIARSEVWPFQRLDGNHFHMLVDPGAVADSILHAYGSDQVL